MDNYKITNLSTNAIYYLNEQEKRNFFKLNDFFINGVYLYSIINLSELKRNRKEKIVDFLLWSALFCAFTLMALIYIQFNY